MQKFEGTAPSGRFQERYQAAVDHLRHGRWEQAHSSYSALMSEFPGRSELHNDFGHLLRMKGQPEQAIFHFSKALEIDPAYAAASYNMAVAQAQLGQTTEAIKNYRRALSLMPNLAEAHNNLANLLRSEGNLDQAVEHYEQALRIRPGFVDAAANLAVALENLHRLDEARNLAGQVVQANPADHIAKLVLARVDLREGKLDEARERLTSLLESNLSPQHQMAVAAELGQVYDRLGHYPDAINAVLHGKQVAHETLDPDRLNDDSFIRRIHRNQEWFTSEQISGWNLSIENAGPAPVFLVGFPRSGTTLTEQVLAAHPAFITSHEQQLINIVLKNMNAILGRPVSYPEDLSNFSETDVRLLRKAYWDEVKTQLGDEYLYKRLIDKLPLNLVHLGFIRRIFPESPVIMVLRDPRDACLSGFLQAFKLNPAMVAFLDMERTADFYSAVMNLWLHYRKTLGLNWIELRYEDLIQDFESQSRMLLDHVGEAWDEGLLQFHESAAERFANTPSYRDVTSPVYTRAVGRWQNYEALIAPVAPRLEKYMTAFGYSG